MKSVALALFAFGAVFMAQVKAQEKKEEKYTEKVTLRAWVEQGKNSGFLNPSELEAYRKTIGNDLVIFTRSGVPNNTMPTPKSEITDAKGKVYIVTKVEGGGGPADYACWVTLKKEAPKKK